MASTENQWSFPPYPTFAGDLARYCDLDSMRVLAHVFPRELFPAFRLISRIPELLALLPPPPPAPQPGQSDDHPSHLSEDEISYQRHLQQLVDRFETVGRTLLPEVPTGVTPVLFRRNAVPRERGTLKHRCEDHDIEHETLTKIVRVPLSQNITSAEQETILIGYTETRSLTSRGCYHCYRATIWAEFLDDPGAAHCLAQFEPESESSIYRKAFDRASSLLGIGNTMGAWSEVFLSKLVPDHAWIFTIDWANPQKLETDLDLYIEDSDDQNLIPDWRGAYNVLWSLDCNQPIDAFLLDLEKQLRSGFHQSVSLHIINKFQKALRRLQCKVGVRRVSLAASMVARSDHPSPPYRPDAEADFCEDMEISDDLQEPLDLPRDDSHGWSATIQSDLDWLETNMHGFDAWHDAHVSIIDGRAESFWYNFNYDHVCDEIHTTLEISSTQDPQKLIRIEFHACIGLLYDSRDEYCVYLTACLPSGVLLRIFSKPSSVDAHVPTPPSTTILRDLDAVASLMSELGLDSFSWSPGLFYAWLLSYVIIAPAWVDFGPKLLDHRRDKWVRYDVLESPMLERVVQAGWNELDHE